ncbi:MAG: hypothetical protein AVDCRST_MAG56-2063, partial [uncultured Cytophagales bacterium]
CNVPPRVPPDCTSSGCLTERRSGPVPVPARLRAGRCLWRSTSGATSRSSFPSRWTFRRSGTQRRR